MEDEENLIVTENENDNSSSNSNNNNTNPTYRTYKRRWYILGLFSLLALHQCLVWNTWGPVDRAVQYAYGWSDATVALMANWGTIVFVLAVGPLSYLLEVYGT